MTDRAADFRHLLDLCRALRLAEKGNLAYGVKPNPEDALRLRAALDLFIAGKDREILSEKRSSANDYDGLVLK